MNSTGRAIGLSFFLIAALFLVLGLGTYLMPDTPGTISTVNEAGIGPRTPRIDPRQLLGNFKQRILRVCYWYRVGAGIYESCRVGVGVTNSNSSILAASHGRLRPGEAIRVYYLPQAPSIGIIHRGVDWMFVGAFVLAGIAMLWFSRWWHAMETAARACSTSLKKNPGKRMSNKH